MFKWLIIAVTCLIYYSTKEKALPYIASLVKRAVETGFQDRFTEIRDGPLVQELPIKSGKLGHLPFYFFWSSSILILLVVFHFDFYWSSSILMFLVVFHKGF